MDQHQQYRANIRKIIGTFDASAAAIKSRHVAARSQLTSHLTIQPDSDKRLQVLTTCHETLEDKHQKLQRLHECLIMLYGEMDKVEAFSRQAAHLQAKYEDLCMYIGAARRSHEGALTKIEKRLQGSLPAELNEEAAAEQKEAGEQEGTGGLEEEQEQEETQREQMPTNTPQDVKSYFSMTRRTFHPAIKKSKTAL
jgi:hypothetical protein